MNEEQIKQMADEYTEQYIPRFQKVVRNAFIDGIRASMEMDVLARDVLNMRSLQIKYSELMHRRMVRKIDGEELAETYSLMRDAEHKVQEMCKYILGIEED